MAYVDFKKASDRVNIKKLLEILANDDVSNRFYTYTHTKQTEWKAINRGVR